MKKTIILIITCVCVAASANAQQGSGRLSLGTGLLYKNGMDITLAYEHEMNYRHAWEFFVNGYLQWAECGSCGHICPESFWRNYRSYGFGVAYKPCMTRGRNHYGSLRIGASAGSDMNKFLGGLHGQLARRDEDDGLHALFRRLDLLEYRQPESRRFTRAGLGLRDDVVLSREQTGNRKSLDGGGCFEPFCLDGREHLLAEA